MCPLPNRGVNNTNIICTTTMLGYGCHVSRLLLLRTSCSFFPLGGDEYHNKRYNNNKHIYHTQLSPIGVDENSNRLFNLGVINRMRFQFYYICLRQHNTHTQKRAIIIIQIIHLVLWRQRLHEFRIVALVNMRQPNGRIYLSSLVEPH